MNNQSDSAYISQVMFSSQNSNDDQNFNIQGRKLVIIYDKVVQVELSELKDHFKRCFSDLDLEVLQYHWNQNKQVILISLSRKRKLSNKKWIKKLQFNSALPRILQYQKSHFICIVNSLKFHYPERKIDKVNKLISKQVSAKMFLKDEPIEFYRYPQIKRSLQIIQAQSMQQILKTNRYKKRRGIYLYGNAGTGKTTIATKIFLDQPFYQKAMNTCTYDSYHYENSILFDQMNPKNSSFHLDQLKNVVNILPAAVNVKFSSKIINPEKIVITSQYRPIQLTKDPSLLQALCKRFRFYEVKRIRDATILQQFDRSESDDSGQEEYHFTSQELGFQKINTQQKNNSCFQDLLVGLRQYVNYSFDVQYSYSSSESQIDVQ